MCGGRAAHFSERSECGKELASPLLTTGGAPFVGEPALNTPSWVRFALVPRRTVRRPPGRHRGSTASTVCVARTPRREARLSRVAPRATHSDARVDVQRDPVTLALGVALGEEAADVDGTAVTRLHTPPDVVTCSQIPACWSRLVGHPACGSRHVDPGMWIPACGSWHVDPGM